MKKILLTACFMASTCVFARAGSDDLAKYNAQIKRNHAVQQCGDNRSCRGAAERDYARKIEEIDSGDHAYRETHAEKRGAHQYENEPPPGRVYERETPGRVDARTGNFQQRVAGGYVDTATGTFHHDVAGGTINTRTGQFTPSN